MKVLVVAEYYPRVARPAWGIWAHRQALAARAAGAEIRVLVLHRPLPSLSAVRSRSARSAWGDVAQPGRAQLDGLDVQYLRYVSPPRPWSYGTWGAWAAPRLRPVLRRIAREFPFQLIHAHYAVPAGDAVRRAAPDTPLVVSVHGGDVHGRHAGGAAVRATFGHARLVLANSAGTAERCRRLGADAPRVVHLGTDPAPEPGVAPQTPTLVTVADLIARKRHADVISALPALRRRHQSLRYVVVGDGPERENLRQLAARLGVAEAVEWTGALPHPEAVARARDASVFVLPSVSEAFGVSYVEAMAAGVPAVGCRSEDGPEEIAAAGGGMALVEPRNPDSLARCLDALLSDPGRRAQLGAAARATVQSSFTWSGCGQDTVAAYRSAIEAPTRVGQP